MVFHWHDIGPVYSFRKNTVSTCRKLTAMTAAA